MGSISGWGVMAGSAAALAQKEEREMDTGEPEPRPNLWHRLPEAVRAWLVLAVVTLATRAWIFGDPVVNLDEQFYLMVGDRMVHGVLPYVDIWDRKPIGLFLIYAAACRMFADPVVGYQLIAAACVLATSRLLFGMARKFAPFGAAVAGAAAYPAWLLVFGGVGGQSPVYYNLPMALAAAWTLRLVSDRAARWWTLQGCGIMLLVGIAIQIKYTAVFEGIYFGLTLLWLGWKRRDGLTLLAGKGLGWIACALAPSGAALAAYAAMGHGASFVQANFLSVFGDRTDLLEAAIRLGGLTLGILPFVPCVWIVWRRGRGQDGTRPTAQAWLLGWLIAAYVGFLLYGVWYDHYTLPLLLPLSVLAAIAFGSSRYGRRLVALILGLGLLGGGGRAAADVYINGTARQLAHLTELVRPAVGNGCLYVNEDLSALYRIVPTCLPSRFVFPQHLMLDAYQNALGVDQLGEIDRMLASRPTVIVMNNRPDEFTLSENRRRVEVALRRDYLQIGKGPVGDYEYLVYRLRGEAR